MIPVSGYRTRRPTRAVGEDGLAGLAAAQGEHPRFLRLAGAAAALRDSIARPRRAGEQAAFYRRYAAAQQALGGAAAAGVWAEGQALTLEQAIEYALQGPPVAVRSSTG
jgi:hypothetical protein